MVEEGDDDSFKRPGAVPFSWEIQPGVPKTRNSQPDHDVSLLQPPKKLPALRLKPFPSSNSSSLPSSFSHLKNRPVSPFAPPPSFKVKSVPVPVPVPVPDSHYSAPSTPRFRSSDSPRTGRDSGRSFTRFKSLFGLKKSMSGDSLFGLKKSKSGDLKKMAQESTSISSESDHFYESETPSEDSSQGSFWSSPKSSVSSLKNLI